MKSSRFSESLSQKIRNILLSTIHKYRIEINDSVLDDLVHCLINRKEESIIQMIEQMNLSFEDNFKILQTVKELKQLVKLCNEEGLRIRRAELFQQIDTLFCQIKIEVSDPVKQFIFDLSKSPAIPSQNQLKYIYENIHISQSQINQVNKLIFQLRTQFQENRDCLEWTFLSFLIIYHQEQHDTDILEELKEVVISGFYNYNLLEINRYFTVMKLSDESRILIKAKWDELLVRHTNSIDNPQIPLNQIKYKPSIKQQMEVRESLVSISEINNEKNINEEEDKSVNLLGRFFQTLSVLNNLSQDILTEQEYSNIFIDESIIEKIRNELSNSSKKPNINFKESELKITMVKKVIQDPINLIDIIQKSKSYLFDILKRRSRIDQYLSELQSHLYEINNDALDEITQLEFIVLFINSVNEQQQSQIGSWISHANYPIPLFVRDKQFRYKAMFKLQSQCYQNYHPVVVNFGTPSTKGTGKTKLILSILGENKENLNFYMNDDQVGLIHDNSILAYYHLYKSIQLIDINYEAVSSMFELNQEFLRGVLTTICFSSIKIIHVSLKHDFELNGSPKKELQKILQDLCVVPSINEKYNRFIILYRDVSPSENQLFNKANESLKRILRTSFAGEISIPNLQKCQNSSFDSKISKISSLFFKILDKLLDENEEQVPSYDFEFFQQFYNNHSKRYFETNLSEIEFKINYKFYNIEINLQIKREFTQINDFEKLFPFQIIDKKIKDKQNELILKQQRTNRYISEFSDIKIEKQKTQLKEDINYLEKNKQTLKLSQPVQSILNILKQDMNSIQVIESALIEWKIPIISPIRKEYGNLLQKLQQVESGQVEVSSEDISRKIRNLDKQINNYDMSFETISSEVVSSLETSNQKDPQIQTIFKSITLQRLLHSKPVNIIDGKTLQFGNIILEQAIESLDQNKKVHVISIIGAQSSAKSTLLNYLFGCGFQISEGRCTKGMYISIFNYENFYILLLDTEGLLSVQARDRTFDHQVCTFAFALSNIVLFNNKGEITSVQKDLLEVCMYALSIVCQAKSKPKIIFCQRDQTSFDQSTQQQILTNLLGNLNEAGRKVGIKVKEVVDITQEDLFLLAPAFISTTGMNENQVSYPNQLFSQQIMKL